MLVLPLVRAVAPAAASLPGPTTAAFIEGEGGDWVAGGQEATFATVNYTGGSSGTATAPAL